MAKNKQKVPISLVCLFLRDVLVSPEEFFEFLKERGVTLEGSSEDDTDEQFEDLRALKRTQTQKFSLKTA